VAVEAEAVEVAVEEAAVVGTLLLQE